MLAALSEHDFSRQIEPYRREIQAHCYRMLGSIHDAEDMVQETFLRAWTRRETFTQAVSLRAWLYKIATNICLDTLKRQKRRGIPQTLQSGSSANDPIPASIMEPIWLDPYPDELLIADDERPEQRMILKENISIAFLAMLHTLPPRQRIALILSDVLDWKASEIAQMMDTTVLAVKSALHRARTRLAELPTYIEPPDNAAAQAALDAYVQAWENADIDLLITLLRDDAVFSMPPTPAWYQGRENIRVLVSKTVLGGSDAAGRWRLLPTRANGQPAFGLYRVGDDGRYQGYGIQVLTFDRGLLTDIITFRHPILVPYFKLPSHI